MKDYAAAITVFFLTAGLIVLWAMPYNWLLGLLLVGFSITASIVGFGGQLNG
jgi:hypothetical protein